MYIGDNMSFLKNLGNKVVNKAKNYLSKVIEKSSKEIWKNN